MLTHKGFWYFLMAGSIGLFLLIALVGYGVLTGYPGTTTGVLAAYLLLHIAEIPHGIRVGRTRGIPAGTAAVKTFLYGFTWWLPLKWGVVQK